MIVVPAAQRLGPLVPTDDDGNPRAGGAAPVRLVVPLCVREEAEGDAARAETSVLRVREGTAPPAAARCAREGARGGPGGAGERARRLVQPAAVPTTLPEDR